MRLTLAYDRCGLEVTLPDVNVRAVLRKPSAVPLADPDAAVRRALAGPIGSAPLEEVACGRRDAVIVVSDVTRPVPNALILPPIVDALGRAGIPRERITVLVATGLHGPCEGEVLVAMLGAEVARSLSVVNHDARDAAAHTRVGVSPAGTPVDLDTRYVDADLKVLTGLIEPHFMAGFSGGAKALLPGIASADSIGAIHGWRMLADVRCRAGNVADNPLQAELAAAARLGGADFLCNVTLSEAREVTGVFCGEVTAAHAAGCEHARRECAACVQAPVDVALTSCAGWPLDTTFYQAAKGVCAPLQIVKPGGTIIVAAGCADGVGGPEYERLLMETGSPEALRARCAGTDEWVIDQWCAQMTLRGCERGRVLFYTDGIPPEKLARCLVEPVASVEQAVEISLAEHGPDATMAVIPEGPYVLAEVGDANG